MPFVDSFAYVFIIKFLDNIVVSKELSKRTNSIALIDNQSVKININSWIYKVFHLIY